MGKQFSADLTVNKCLQKRTFSNCLLSSSSSPCSRRNTSSTSGSELSVPWTRASLLNTPTYVASVGFVSQVGWVKSSNQSELVVASTDVEDTETPTSRATCAVVGTVSPNRLYLEPHGNYNPNFEKTALETSKAQFQLVSPTLHPDFVVDFDRGIKNIETIQKMAFKEGPSAEHFVVTDNGKKALKFSCPLFEKRVRQLSVFSCFSSKPRLMQSLNVDSPV
jgi:hypothetical protein